MWKHITFETREDALKASAMLRNLWNNNCLNEKVCYFGVGNPGDTMDNQIYLRTLSIKIKD